MKEFNELLISDKYIKWLAQFLKKYNKFDNIYFVHNNHHCLNQNDLKMIGYLENLLKELNKYIINKNINCETIFSYALSYEDEIYIIEYDGEGYSATKNINNIMSLPCIDYYNFKNNLSRNMQTNFQILKDRVIDSLENTDLEFLRNEFSKLVEPTIFSGVGGSNIVSEFGAKVLNQKNNIITINSEPRDFIYRNNNVYKNVVACSYSGNNYGIKMSFYNQLKQYLLSNNSFNDKNVTNLKYNTTISKEESFISLGAALIPISILMDYYLDGESNIMLDYIDETKFDFDLKSNIFEIFSGYDTSVSSKYLEVTMVESGLGIPIVHDKYDYCHGRSTLSINYDCVAIYYNRNTEFDKIMLNNLKKYYQTIIIIDSKFKDQILDEFQMLIQSMYLTKYIASKKAKDLSKIKWSPLANKLYKYSGKI